MENVDRFNLTAKEIDDISSWLAGYYSVLSEENQQRADDGIYYVEENPE
jgi:hypothetical protein